MTQAPAPAPARGARRRRRALLRAALAWLLGVLVLPMAAWVVGFLLFRDDTWAAAAPPGQAGPGHLPYPLISIVVGAAIGVAVSSRAGLGPRQRRLMPLVGMVLTPFLPLLVIYALFFAGVWTLN